MATSVVRRALAIPHSLFKQCRQLQTSHSCYQPWKLGKLNHIAIACPDLDKATTLYRDLLHAKVSEKQALPSHGVTVVFVELGDTKIEVNDISAAMQEMKSKNIRMLSNKPSTGAHGNPVVFLHPKDCNGVLVELEEV
ncbi:methylmalonyl-CoA epimerase, mitochondrial-like isoform X2 [Littorina saxatilis]|uniref:methylmalonyl-CoA epimerase, mitochondrial-like isoform X2 n=1 Tax=Littorina saxatilis TaxID=31220 RepID=UPI0038B5CEF7